MKKERRVKSTYALINANEDLACLNNLTPSKLNDLNFTDQIYLQKTLGLYLKGNIGIIPF